MIDPDRSRAVKALLASEPLDLILSDDGMQHYRLARDLELVLIDAARGLGNRRCLPAGPLREPVERLQSVDALLYNGAGSDREDGFAFRLQPTALVNLHSGERQPLEHFPAGQPVHAVAGIGNPQRFFNTLETLHWQPIPHAFADHAAIQRRGLEFYAVVAAGDDRKGRGEVPRLCRSRLVVPGGRCGAVAGLRGLVRHAVDASAARSPLALNRFFQGMLMDTKLLDILACPICKGPLKLSADKTELISKGRRPGLPDPRRHPGDARKRSPYPDHR